MSVASASEELAVLPLFEVAAQVVLGAVERGLVHRSLLEEAHF